MSSATFPMLDGDPIAMERAKEVYRMYCCVFGSNQTLERIGQRGGFGHTEISYIQKRHDKNVATKRCTCNRT